MGMPAWFGQKETKWIGRMGFCISKGLYIVHRRRRIHPIQVRSVRAPSPRAELQGQRAQVDPLYLRLRGLHHRPLCRF